MRAVCVQCGEGKPLNKKDTPYFTGDNEFFCSLNCFTEYVEQMKRVALDPNIALLTPEHERKTDGTIYSPALGATFRSGFEAVVAEWMILEKKWKVWYEPFLIKVGDNKHYIPDFYLPDFGVFLEVKGLWQGSGKRKFQVASGLLGRDRLLIIPPLYRGWFQRNTVSLLE